MSERCGYRKESCSDTGISVDGEWVCQRHRDMDELQQLREQNRVLVELASTAVERWRAQTNVKEGISFRMAMKALEAALTATSPPAAKCLDCHNTYAQCRALRAQGKLACCPDCRHTATSQEGQHG